MGDIEYWYNSFQSELSTLPYLVKEINQSQKNGPYAIQSGICNAEDKVKRCEDIKKSYKLELNLLVGFPVQRQKYEHHLQELDKELQTCKSKLEEAKSSAQRSELVSGTATHRNLDPEKDGNIVLHEIGRTQDKTKKSLERTQNLVEEAKHAGVSTLEELRGQRKQIGRVADEVVAMEGELARAKKLIRIFGRRLATDKFIKCFACINISMLLAVVLLICL